MTPGGYDRWFAAGLVIGGAVLLNGVRGLIASASTTRPPDFARWFLGSLVVHDLVVAPLVFAMGWVLARLVSPRLRAVVLPPLVASGVVLLFAWPLVRGYGGRADNPSLLPRDYVRGLVVALAVIWTSAAIAALMRGLRRSPLVDEPRLSGRSRTP